MWLQLPRAKGIDKLLLFAVVLAFVGRVGIAAAQHNQPILAEFMPGGMWHRAAIVDAHASDTGQIVAAGIGISPVTLSDDVDQVRGFIDRIVVWDVTKQSPIIEIPGAPSKVACFCLSADGHVIAVGDRSGEVRTYRTSNGELLSTIRAHSEEVQRIQFSQDSSKLVTNDITNRICVSNVKTGEPVFQVNRQGFTFSTISHDGSVLVVSNLSTLDFYDIHEAEVLRRTRISAIVGDIAFSRSGEYVALATETNIVSVVDCNDGTVVQRFRHPAWVTAISFSADGEKLYVGGVDGSLAEWLMSESKGTVVIKGEGDADGEQLTRGAQCLRFAPGGKFLIQLTAALRALQLVDVESRKRLVLDPAKHESVHLAFSPDGRALASYEWDGVIRVYDVERATTKELTGGHVPADPRFLPNDLMSIGHVVWSPDGSRLYSAFEDLCAWEVDDDFKRTLLAEGLRTNEFIYSVACAPREELLVTGARDVRLGTPGLFRAVTVRDAKSGQIQRVGAGQDDDVLCVAWSHDGTLLAGASQYGSVGLWEADIGRRRAVLAGHVKDALHVEFSPDDQLLVSVGLDGVVIVWNIEEQRERFRIAAHEGRLLCAAFGPDDKTLITGSSDGLLVAWNLETGKERYRIRHHRSPVRAIAFSADGERFATADAQGQLLIWDARKLQPGK